MFTDNISLTNIQLKIRTDYSDCNLQLYYYFQLQDGYGLTIGEECKTAGAAWLNFLDALQTTIAERYSKSLEDNN